MFRRSLGFALSLVAALAIAMPLATHAANAKDSKTSTAATLEILDTATLAGKQIEPGTYRVVVDGSKVTLQRGGKMVAEASVEWKDTESKAAYTNIVTQEHKITQIHFGGKTRYIQIAE